jgi:hypothetical protein
LQEEVSLAKVNEDPELLKSAHDLLDALKAQPNAQNVINQNISKGGVVKDFFSVATVAV